MKPYAVLKKEFDRKVVDLQKGCLHLRRSAPIEVHWAPGHSTGRRVRRCLKCHMVFEVGEGV